MFRLNLTAHGFLLIFLTASVPANAVDVTFHSSHSFPTEDGVNAAVTGDFTGDGHSDIVASLVGSRVYLLEGDGTGQFSEGVLVADLGRSAGILVEVTDLDNDGALDLFVSHGVRDRGSIRDRSRRF